MLRRLGRRVSWPSRRLRRRSSGSARHCCSPISARSPRLRRGRDRRPRERLSTRSSANGPSYGASQLSRQLEQRADKRPQLADRAKAALWRSARNACHLRDHTGPRLLVAERVRPVRHRPRIPLPREGRRRAAGDRRSRVGIRCGCWSGQCAQHDRGDRDELAGRASDVARHRADHVRDSIVLRRVGQRRDDLGQHLWRARLLLRGFATSWT